MRGKYSTAVALTLGVGFVLTIPRIWTFSVAVTERKRRFLTLFHEDSWLWPAIIGGVLIGIALYFKTHARHRDRNDANRERVRELVGSLPVSRKRKEARLVWETQAIQAFSTFEKRHLDLGIQLAAKKKDAEKLDPVSPEYAPVQREIEVLNEQWQKMGKEFEEFRSLLRYFNVLKY